MSTRTTAELQKQLEDLKGLMLHQEQTAAAAAETAAAAALTAAATAEAAATAAADTAASAAATAAAAATSEKVALQLRIDDLERAQTLASGLTSRLNLSSAMTPAQLDETTVKIWITDSEARNRNQLDLKFADLETKIQGLLPLNQPFGGTQVPHSGATPTTRVGPFSPQTRMPTQTTTPTNPSLGQTTNTISGSITIPPVGPTTNIVGATNDYDKAIEVEQRLLRNPDLTPQAIRSWKLTYETYERHPNHRMTIVDAFGDDAINTLGMMFPTDIIPMDQKGFAQYLSTKFLTAENLFADIKSAASAITMKQLHGPLTLVALQKYLASFCKMLTTFAVEITIRNSDPDLHKTLVRAFYDGISSQPFTNQLNETSCSTWQAAQKNFRDCLTATNVQLANAQYNTNRANHDWKANKKDKDTSAHPEGKKALSATLTKNPPDIPTTPTKKPPAIDKTFPPCKNCRSNKHETMDCPAKECFDCRDNGEEYKHRQSECTIREWKEHRVAKLARHAAREAAYNAAYADSDSEYYTDS